MKLITQVRDSVGIRGAAGRSVEDVAAEAIMSNENLSVIGNLEEKIPALAEVMWKDLQSALKKDRFQAARPGQERNGPLLYLI